LGVEEALATKTMFVHPGEKKPCSVIVGENLFNLSRRPPLQSDASGCRHVEWTGKAACIGDDVQKFRKHLRSKS
jgi:hypothetical protein